MRRSSPTPARRANAQRPVLPPAIHAIAGSGKVGARAPFSGPHPFVSARLGARWRPIRRRTTAVAGAMFFHVSSSTASLARAKVSYAFVRAVAKSALLCVAQCELEKELILYPRHFGPNLDKLLTEKLIAKVG